MPPWVASAKSHDSVRQMELGVRCGLSLGAEATEDRESEQRKYPSVQEHLTLRYAATEPRGLRRAGHRHGM